MRFAKDGKMGKHVDYWLKRGLGVWARIGALARRFGGFGSLGAWEVMRLVQGAYLPTVKYGLEFIMDDHVAVKKINIHVLDCLRSLFRMPLRLANIILHSECGIPRRMLGVHIFALGAPRDFPTMGIVILFRSTDRFGMHGVYLVWLQYV